MCFLTFVVVVYPLLSVVRTACWLGVNWVFWFENFQNAELKPFDTRPRLLQTELPLLISVSILSKEPTDRTI